MRLFDRRLGQDEQELLAAVAHRYVGLPQLAPEDFRHVREQRVPRLVPVRIVVFLE